MSKTASVWWLTLHPETPIPPDFEHLEPGLRAAIDDDGQIWAFAGLLEAKEVGLLLAAGDGEPVLLDGPHCYLRTAWMRENLVTDAAGAEILSLIESMVRQRATH